MPGRYRDKWSLCANEDCHLPALHLYPPRALVGPCIYVDTPYMPLPLRRCSRYGTVCQFGVLLFHFITPLLLLLGHVETLKDFHVNSADITAYADWFLPALPGILPFAM